MTTCLAIIFAEKRRTRTQCGHLLCGTSTVVTGERAGAEERITGWFGGGAADAREAKGQVERRFSEDGGDMGNGDTSTEALCSLCMLFSGLCMLYSELCMLCSEFCMVSRVELDVRAGWRDGEGEGKG